MCWPPQLHPILVVNRLQEVTCSTLVWAIFKEYNDYKIECSNCQPVDGDVEGGGDFGSKGGGWECGSMVGGNVGDDLEMTCIQDLSPWR